MGRNVHLAVLIIKVRVLLHRQHPRFDELRHFPALGGREPFLAGAFLGTRGCKHLGTDTGQAVQRRHRPGWAARTLRV